MTNAIEIPEAVRAKARVAGADNWLAGLPELVGELEREWSITVGGAFGDATEADVTAIWEWGVVERVSTGLLLTSIGVQPVGRQMLGAADRISLSAA